MSEGKKSERTCATCPSFLDPPRASVFFGGSGIGQSMCAQFGHILNTDQMKPRQRKKLHKTLAKDCKKYGVAQPVEPPERPEARIATPAPEALMKDQPDQIYSCQQCVNLIPYPVTYDEFGVAGDLCAAQGRIILRSNYKKEAVNCQWRERKGISRGTDGMNLLPLYSDAMEAGVQDPVKAYIDSAGTNLIDPQDYPTDAPVTEEDQAAGIRGWRKIRDPKGTGHSTFLPIFDIDSFDEVEQAKIPRTGDNDHPEWYADAGGYVYTLAVEWMELDETPALWGASGIGKTELARHMAWLMSLPFERISIHKSSEIDDLAGKYILQDKDGKRETVFQEGRVVKAWKKPCVLLLDEPNLGPDDVWQFFRPLTDNSRQLVLDMADGRMIKRDDSCFFMFAMNPSWDAKNIGTNEIGDADGNRLAHIYFELPDPRVERIILTRRCEADGWTPSDKVLDFVMGVASDIRALVDDNSIPISWNIRPNIQVIRHLKWFDPITAYKRAVTDMQEPDVAKMILDFVSTRIEDEDDLLEELQEG